MTTKCPAGKCDVKNGCSGVVITAPGGKTDERWDCGCSVCHQPKPEVRTGFLQVGRTIECGTCHPEKFGDCKELRKLYKHDCDCICHDKPSPASTEVKLPNKGTLQNAKVNGKEADIFVKSSDTGDFIDTVNNDTAPQLQEGTSVNYRIVRIGKSAEIKVGDEASIENPASTEKDGKPHEPGECTCAERGNDPGRCSEYADSKPASAEEYEDVIDHIEWFKTLTNAEQTAFREILKKAFSSHDQQLRQRIVEGIKKELEPIGVCMEKADEKLRTGKFGEYDDESSLRETVKQCIEIMEPLECLLTFITNL